MSDRFKPCHALVNPELFRDNCIFDMCEYNGMEATLCDNVEAYAQACQSAGVTISWRNTTFCRKLSQQELNLTKTKMKKSCVLQLLVSYCFLQPCPALQTATTPSALLPAPPPALISSLLPVTCLRPPVWRAASVTVATS